MKEKKTPLCVLVTLISWNRIFGIIFVMININQDEKWRMKSMQENEAIQIKAWIESEVKIRGLICTSHQLQSSLYIVINEILFHCNNVIEAVWRHQWYDVIRVTTFYWLI